MLLKFPTSHVVLNQPIGPIPAEAMAGRTATAAAKFARPLRPRVDAIVLDDQLVTLVEAEMWEIRRSVGDLSFYRPLIPETPELARYAGVPLKLLLVVPEGPPWLDTVAAAHGIDVDYYSPEWLADVIQRNANYHTAEYRQKREMRKQVLDQLGLN